MPSHLQLPVGPDRIRTLRAGDEVVVSGRIVTAREPAYRRLAAMLEPRVRAALQGSFVYHCGPVVAPVPGGGWRFVAAGPSRSAPLEPWGAEVLARYGARGMLGRGGMGDATLAALREHGAVYLHLGGALAVSLARCVRRVVTPHLLHELGVTDAVWEIEVDDLPAVVTMDAHGHSLHAGARALDAVSSSSAGA